MQILALPSVLENLVDQEGLLDQFFQVSQVLLEVLEFQENPWDQVVQEDQFQGFLVLLCYQVCLVSLVGLEVQGHLEGLLPHLCLEHQAGQVSLAELWFDLAHL